MEETSVQEVEVEEMSSQEVRRKFASFFNPPSEEDTQSLTSFCEDKAPKENGKLERQSGRATNEKSKTSTLTKS